MSDKKKIASWILLNDPLSFKLKGDPYKYLEELEKKSMRTLLRIREEILSMKKEGDSE